MINQKDIKTMAKTASKDMRHVVNITLKLSHRLDNDDLSDLGAFTAKIKPAVIQFEKALGVEDGDVQVTSRVSREAV